MVQVSNMKALAIFVLSVFTTNLFASDEAAPFNIDAEKMMELFLAAVVEQYPDIPQQDLMLDHGITVLCFSTNPGKRIPSNEEFRPCWASIEFEPGSKPFTSRYSDREGECKIHRGIEIVSARLESDGIIRVGSRSHPDNPETVLPCENDAVVPPNQSTLRQEELRFSVNSKRLVAISLAAVRQALPDIPVEDLILSSVIYLWCRPDSQDKGIPGIHMKLKPCYAKIPFENNSDITEWKEMDSEGNCTITTRIGKVKVMIMQNGDVSVNDSGWGETEPQVVECTPEFLESLDSRT